MKKICSGLLNIPDENIRQVQRMLQHQDWIAALTLGDHVR